MAAPPHSCSNLSPITASLSLQVIAPACQLLQSFLNPSLPHHTCTHTLCPGDVHPAFQKPTKGHYGRICVPLTLQPRVVYMCVCFCVCVCERERGKYFVFLSWILHLLPPHFYPALPLSLTLALLDTRAVIPVVLTDYSSCSSYRSPSLPHHPINLLPIKPWLNPGCSSQWCELMLIFTDHTGLNTAGRWRSQCLPVAHPFIQTTDFFFFRRKTTFEYTCTHSDLSIFMINIQSISVARMLLTGTPTHLNQINDSSRQLTSV